MSNQGEWALSTNEFIEAMNSQLKISQLKRAPIAEAASILPKRRRKGNRNMHAIVCKMDSEPSVENTDPVRDIYAKVYKMDSSPQLDLNAVKFPVASEASSSPRDAIYLDDSPMPRQFNSPMASGANSPMARAMVSPLASEVNPSPKMQINVHKRFLDTQELLKEFTSEPSWQNSYEGHEAYASSEPYHESSQERIEAYTTNTNEPFDVSLRSFIFPL